MNGICKMLSHCNPLRQGLLIKGNDIWPTEGMQKLLIIAPIRKYCVMHCIIGEKLKFDLKNLY